jgi:hypothetical protein
MAPAIDRSRPRTVFRANGTGDGASWFGAKLAIGTRTSAKYVLWNATGSEKK